LDGGPYTVDSVTSISSSFTTGHRVRTTDGVGIATYDMGGNGPPLLLCHATGFHGRVWLPVAAHLQDDFHCIAFDFRGHGGSDKAPGGNYEWIGFARDVMAVLKEFCLEGGKAVGHSGGGAATLLAEEEWPGTFRSLYSFEPAVPMEGASPEPDPDRTNVMAEGTRRRREVFDSREEAHANYRAKLPFSDFDPEAVRAYVDYGFDDLPGGGVQLSCRRDDEARVYENALSSQTFQRLHEISCPVTLVYGGRLAHFGPEAISAMAGQLGNATTEMLSDVGHFGPMERPAIVADSIRRAFTAMDAMTAAGPSIESQDGA
jgi:pimeloyl-ACP methyl ester carboxylesterase